MVPGRAYGPSAPLLIGKSLGSYAAVPAAERGLPAVWLTPLLTSTVVPPGAAVAGVDRGPLLYEKR